MKSFKFQHANLRQIQQLWFLFVVSIPWIVAFDETEGHKTFNVKIGFDLKPASNGASALRIRNFEDNDESQPFQRKLRAQSDASRSSSSSIENEKKKAPEEGSLEMKAAEEISISEEASEDSDGMQKSTVGLRADDYEPEGHSPARQGLNKNSESEDSTS